jgi:cellulose synthase (UDP-forming)
MSDAAGNLGQIPPFPNHLTGNLYSRLRDRTLLFRYLVIINLIFGAWYLHWRATASINFQVFWVSIPLFLAELYSYMGGLLFLVGLWRPLVRQVRSLAHMRPTIPTDTLPTVDALITCYNEPVDLVEATVKAALAMDYPPAKLRVYVLDDGASTEMEAMADRLGLEDLATSPMQTLAHQLQQERLALISQQRQLQTFKPDLIGAATVSAPFQLTVPSDSQALDAVLDWFNPLKWDSIPERTWLELVTALGEIFDNVLEHAHRDLPPETPIQLQVTLLSQAIQLQVWDQGLKFDLETYLHNTQEIDLEAEGGRGLLIVRQVADYYSYVRRADRNCFTLIKQYEPIEAQRSTPQQLSHYLQSFQQFLGLQSSGSKPVEDIVALREQELAAAIDAKETALGNLIRCRYIARPKPKGRPHYAKAGNINYALFSGGTTGDLIITFDADHVPKPQYLQRVVPYFFNFDLHSGAYKPNTVAFVQTPQAFHNLPPGDIFGHEAHLFYGPIQQAKDGMNAAFYTGTNATLRREALVSMGLQNFALEFEQDEQRLEDFDLIGGVSSISITEDMNTAMRLHGAGWRSVYHDEVLAEGLAPDDLLSTMKQKLRWAQGTIQVLYRDNPLTKPGLSFWQRWQYFQTMYSYFSGFFILILLVCPILYFYTGIIPVQAYGTAFAFLFFPAFTHNRLSLGGGGWGIPAQELWRSEQYAIALFPLYIQAVWSVSTGRSIKFEVTPKQRQSGVYLQLVWPQLLLVILTLLGIIWGGVRWGLGLLAEPGLFLVNVGWSLYNLSLLSIVIQAAIWQPEPGQPEASHGS